MQCRLPLSCELGIGQLGVFKGRNAKTCNVSNDSHDLDNLFGFAVLNPPLCVANVQVFGVLRVQVSHNVGPPLKKSPVFTGPKPTGEYVCGDSPSSRS